MRFVFEDKADDLLSKLFCSAYSSDRNREFIFSGGIGKVAGIVDSILKETKENVCVFIDAIPGNLCIIKEYRKLRKMAIDHPGRMMVMPCVCSEYYLIQVLNRYELVDTMGVGLCLDRQPYFSSTLITTEDDKKFCKNFEKYCKLILLKSVPDCIRHTRGNSEMGINRQYGIYYEKDCKYYKQLKEKAIEYVQAWPCFPKIFNTAEYGFSVKELNAKHKELVDSYNNMTHLFQTVVPEEQRVNYKDMQYLPDFG